MASLDSTDVDDASMKAESKVQLAMAVVGVPLIFFLWKPDAKWPNPFALSGPSSPPKSST